MFSPSLAKRTPLGAATVTAYESQQTPTMKKDDKIIPSGPFKGKRIEFAPTTGIDMFPDVVADFMKQIFDFEPGDYLMSDESSLYDFTGVDEMELRDI